MKQLIGWFGSRKPKMTSEEKTIAMVEQATKGNPEQTTIECYNAMMNEIIKEMNSRGYIATSTQRQPYIPPTSLILFSKKPATEKETG